jgi:hypothetical protein
MTGFLDPGTEEGALAYVKGSVDSVGRTRELPPELVCGHEDRFHSACRNSGLAHPYNSIGLFYSEPAGLLKFDQQRRHLLRLARLLRGGLPNSRVVDVGYLHRKLKAGCDSHLFQCKLDLLTHGQLPIWSCTGAEIELLNTWRGLVNREEGLTDPDDPWARRYLAKIPKSLSAEHRREFRTLDLQLTACAADGWIADREELIEVFELRDYRVAKTTESGVAVLNRTGVTFWFCGAKYIREFDFQQIVDARCMERKRDPAVVEEEIKSLKAKLADLEEQRIEDFARRFGCDELTCDHSVHAELLQAYPGAPSHRKLNEPPTIFLTVNAPSNSATQPTDEQPTQCKPDGCDRLKCRRAVCAEASLRRVGAPLAGALRAVRAGFETAGRIGALESDSERIVEASLAAARELSRCVEELADPGRVGSLVRKAEHDLEPTLANCRIAQRALERLQLGGATPGLRSPSGMLPLNFKPRVEPALGGLQQ